MAVYLLFFLLIELHDKLYYIPIRNYEKMTDSNHISHLIQKLEF